MISSMLKIRLQRTGRKNDPSFRIVVVEGTEGPRTGNHIAVLGFYNAVTKEKRFDGDEAKKWIAKGAKPSDTVFNMLITEGVIEGKKRNVLPKKTPTQTETPDSASPSADKPADEAAPVPVASETSETTKADESPEVAPLAPPPASESSSEAPAEAATEPNEAV